MFSRRITPFMTLPSPDVFSEDGGGAPSEKFFFEREFFSSGRGALLRGLALANPNIDRRVFLPNFFCPQIIKLVKKYYEVEFYEDLPSETSPRFCTLSPARGDIVVAVDFFGLRRRPLWEKWRAENSGVVLFEDHSHAPFSDWALNSAADYAFASLRKWTNLPDGAWLRRPNAEVSKIFSRGGGLSEFASRFLEGAALESFGVYDEKLYYSGETILYTAPSVSRMSEYSLSVLKKLDIQKIAGLRFGSLAAFCRALDLPQGVRELNSELGDREPLSVYFPVLKFESHVLRDRIYAELRKLDIFACIFWGGLGKESSVAALEESRTTFEPPLDFRHTHADAEKLAALINRLVRDFA